eukprot:GAHX01001555.1.p1 GENE.GAHX01001555.1~~GAHX01001555.1.p1  ORF type:complete len:754 (-),score=177.80 GAHX01001555.1:472-2733(-)
MDSEDVVDYIKIEHASDTLQELFNSDLLFTDLVRVSKTLTVYKPTLFCNDNVSKNVRLKTGSLVSGSLSERYMLVDNSSIYFFKSKTSSQICDYFKFSYIKTIYFCSDFPEITCALEAEEADGWLCIKLNQEGRRDELLTAINSGFKKTLNKNLLIVPLEEYDYNQIKSNNILLRKKLSSVVEKKTLSNRFSSFFNPKRWFSFKSDKQLNKQSLNSSFSTISGQSTRHSVSSSHDYSMEDIKQLKETLELNGHFYEDSKKLTGLILEGFAMKQKGSKNSYDLKYFIVLKNDITYYNVDCIGIISLSPSNKTEIKKVSEYSIEIYFEHLGPASKTEKDAKISEVGFVLKSLRDSLGNKPNIALQGDGNTSNRICLNLIFDEKRQTHEWFSLLINRTSKHRERRSSFKLSIDEINESSDLLETIKLKSTNKTSHQIWCKIALRWENNDFRDDQSLKTYLIFDHNSLGLFRCKSIKNVFRKPDEKFTGDILVGLERTKNAVKAKNFQKKTCEMFFNNYCYKAILNTENRNIYMIFDSLLKRALWGDTLAKTWNKESFGFKVNKSYLKAYEEIAPNDKELVFLFSDIENKSSLWQSMERDKVKRLFEDHDKILRTNARKYNGYEVKNEGESFFFVFKEIKDALKWSVSIIRDLVKYETIHLKLGMKFGEVEKIERMSSGRVDYFGNSVNFAARLKDYAKKGQILISENELNHFNSDQNIEKDEFFEETEFVYLDDVQLKGLSKTSKLYNLVDRRENG